MLKKVVSINAIRHNAKVIKSRATKRKVCAVVKADAYGFSIEPVTMVLNNYVDFFAVASSDEAKQVAKLTNKQILILTPYEKLVSEQNVVYTVSSLQGIKDIENLAKKYKRRVSVHVKVDSGMHRLGFNNILEFVIAINYIKNSEFLILKGVYTHFAKCNERNLKKQDKRFREFLKQVKLPRSCLIHSASSFALFSKYKTAGNAVRCGLAFYGGINKFNLMPIFKAYANIVEIKQLERNTTIGYDYTYLTKKPTKIAIINCGYFDGINRLLSTPNKSYFYVDNKKCLILGRVAMNLIAIDVTNIKNIELKDKAYFIRNTIDAQNIAKKTNTIVYEVFTSLKNCDIIYV